MRNKRKILGLTAVASLLSLSAVLASCDKAKEYTVTFKNGNETVATQPVVAGFNAKVPDAPTGDTEFNGWYSDAALTQPFDFGKVITEDTTVYANWVKNYTVTFNSNGGSSVQAKTVREGANVAVPTAPTGETEFNGWYSDAALTTPFNFGSVINADTTVYAKWIKKYTVTFNTNGGTAVDAAIVKEGMNVTMPAEPRKDDADFVGWYSDAALTTPFNFGSVINKDTTVYAKWAPLPELTAITMGGKTYATVAAALAAVPADSTETFVINLPVGTYEENGLQYEGSATIHIKGNTRALYGSNVVIKGHGSDMTQEKSRNLISIRGTGNIILENLTLESDWTRTMAGSNNAQAEVLGTDTKGNTVAYNCGFKSHQDTIRTAGKAWFYGCYVEGDVDFLWMEQAGSVALYENCEIVSVRDHDETSTATSTYFAAPRMAKVKKVGKGLVIYNSVCKESDDARKSGQSTYMARNPWSGSSDYYNQVAYINVDISDIESKIWYNDPTATEFPKTAVGYKMDQATADRLGYAGNGDILSAEDVEKEFSGREAIINRVYNTGKLKYEKDQNYWDINALIAAQGWKVEADTSSASSAEEVGITTTTYKFDGSQDLSALTIEGFEAHNSGSYAGGAGSTITVPVTGKGYVEVYGFYSGTVETVASTQGMQVMFFNNSTTSAEIENDYIVYDASTSSITITAKGTTYITKIAVVNDASTEKVDVASIEITGNTKNYCVGVPLRLTAKVNPGTAVNKSVVWSSSNETIGVIDKYTGKVTFLTAGDVVFTATATDGSGITGTFACSPINPTWVSAEWYTTDSGDGKLAEEAGATEIGVFDVGGSSNKDFKINNQKTSFTFTNIKGVEITTEKGLKLNSSGSLSFATTKGNATLTVITIKDINEYVTPIVNDGTNNAQLLKSTENADGTVTYIFDIPTAGVWKISRGDETKECNPILYAKVVYELRITKDTFVNYKGGAFHAELDDEVKLNHNNSETGSSVDSTAKITYDNFTYEGAQSHGKDNWLEFNKGAKITFTTANFCALKIRFYSGNNQVKVTLNGEEVQCFKKNGKEAVADAYYLATAGDVVIEATGNGFLGCFDVIMGEEAPEPEPETPEEEVVTGPAKYLNYDFANLANKPVDGEAVASTGQITFVNCVAHNGSYVALKTNNAVKINLAAGATLTVTMPYSSGVTLNGEAYTLVDNKLVYTAIADGEVVITGAAGNAYITTITVTTPLSSLNYDFATLADKPTDGEAVASIDGVTFVNCVAHNGSYVALKTNNAVKINLAAGATLTVTMPYSSGVTLNGEAYTLVDNKLVYLATADGEVVITGAAGNAYITTITITSPLSSLYYDYASVANGAAQGAVVANTAEITFVGCVEHDGTGKYIRLTENNAVKLALAKGALLTVYMPYSNGVTVNGEAVTLVDNKLIYKATSSGVVTISGAAGNAYITKITVSTPVSSLEYNYSAVANGAAQNAAVANTKEITFVGCVEHDGTGTYIRLTNNNAVTVNVAKGAILTVYMPYSTGVTVNGEAVTLVDNKLIYKATADGEVVISGAAGNAYITKITVSMPVTSLNYDYSAVANGAAQNAVVENTDEIKFVGCVEHDGTGTYIRLTNNNAVTINLAKGATLTVYMPYSTGVTVNGTAVTLVDNKLVYTATDDGEVVISGAAGNAYITKITVSSPVSSLVYNYSSVANGAAKGTAVANTAEITFVGCVEHDGTGTYIALKENNSVSINLAAGATLTVYMPYSSGVTLNGEAVTLVDNKLVYTATNSGVVVISGTAGNAYITKITVTKD